MVTVNKAEFPICAVGVAFAVGDRVGIRGIGGIGGGSVLIVHGNYIPPAHVSMN